MSLLDKPIIRHHSPSSVNKFIACPSAWIANYVFKRHWRPGPAAHWGTSVEHGVSLGLFDPKASISAISKEAEAVFRKKIGFRKNEKSDEYLKTIGDCVELATMELRQYGIPSEPHENSRNGQHEIKIQHDNLKLPSKGYLDFEFPQHGIIVDQKCTMRMPDSVSDPHARQGALYTADGPRSNYEMRFCYTTPQKVQVYPLEDRQRHYNAYLSAARKIEVLLSLSESPEFYASFISPDYSSFYWNGDGAREIGEELFGV